MFDFVNAAAAAAAGFHTTLTHVSQKARQALALSAEIFSLFHISTLPLPPPHAKCRSRERVRSHHEKHMLADTNRKHHQEREGGTASCLWSTHVTSPSNHHQARQRDSSLCQISRVKNLFFPSIVVILFPQSDGLRLIESMRFPRVTRMLPLVAGGQTGWESRSKVKGPY